MLGQFENLAAWYQINNSENKEPLDVFLRCDLSAFNGNWAGKLLAITNSYGMHYQCQLMGHLSLELWNQNNTIAQDLSFTSLQNVISYEILTLILTIRCSHVLQRGRDLCQHLRTKMWLASVYICLIFCHMENCSTIIATFISYIVPHYIQSLAPFA